MSSQFPVMDGRNAGLAFFSELGAVLGTPVSKDTSRHDFSGA
jgi:hypothetical protein